MYDEDMGTDGWQADRVHEDQARADGRRGRPRKFNETQELELIGFLSSNPGATIDDVVIFAK